MIYEPSLERRPDGGTQPCQTLMRGGTARAMRGAGAWFARLARLLVHISRLYASAAAGNGRVSVPTHYDVALMSRDPRGECSTYVPLPEVPWRYRL